MLPNISVCCLSLLLVNFIAAKSISDMQSLTQLLEDEISNMPFSSSEVEESDFSSDKSLLGAPEQQQQQQQQPWSSSDLRSSALGAKDNALAHFVKDFLRTSKRSWTRYKKGALRSCFGGPFRENWLLQWTGMLSRSIGVTPEPGPLSQRRHRDI